MNDDMNREAPRARDVIAPDIPEDAPRRAKAVEPDGSRLTEQELREWVLDRYGSASLADDLEMARQLHDDAQTVASNGDLPRDDEIPFDQFVADLNERLHVAGRPAVQTSRPRAV